MDYNSLPFGLAVSAVLNEKFTNLSEAQKEDVIFRCRDAKSSDEVEKILDSVGEADAADLMNSEG